MKGEERRKEFRRKKRKENVRESTDRKMGGENKRRDRKDEKGQNTD